MINKLGFGSTYIAICINSTGYEKKITTGKEYAITVTGEIVDTGLLCSLIDDNGKKLTCRLTRFREKV